MIATVDWPTGKACAVVAGALLVMVGPGVVTLALDGPNVEPVNAADLYAQGLAAFSDGEFAEAVRLIEAAVAAQPDAVSYRLLLGQAYSRTGESAKARRCFQKVIEQDPTDPDAHYQLGNTYLHDEKYALAVESYQAALRLGATEPEVHFKLARAHARLENYLGAVKTRLVPGGAAGRVEDGVYLIEQVPNETGRFFVAPAESAIYHVQLAIDGGLDTPELHLLHADVWLHAGRYARARAIYERIEDRVPDDQRAAYYHNDAQACLGLDDLEGYLERLGKAVAIDAKTYGPQLAGAYRVAADRSSAAGDLANQIRYLRLAVAESPDSDELHYALGNSLYETGRSAEASHHWRMTLQLRPNHPDRERMLELIRVIASETPSN